MSALMLAPVAPSAPAIVSRFADRFHSPYVRVLDGIETALASKSQDRIASAFAGFGELRPEHVKLPASASRDEKRDARDDYLSAVKCHQRALREAFAMARDAGAAVSERFAGSVSSSGAVSVRQTVTAKLAPTKRTSVRL